MKKTISLILLVLVVLACVGCSDAEEHTVITTPKPTIAPSTNGTTAPTTSPTKPTTKAPTIHEHPEPGKNEDDLEYTPEDIPEVYWAVLNDREAIYFPNGCTDCTYGPCYAWLDDYTFPYLHNAIATSDYVEYAVIDMDGDGNTEVLIRDNDTLLLREKDGIVYGYTFGFRGMDYVYTDGTFTWNDSAGRNYGVSKLKFNEDNTYQWISLCEVNGADDNGEDYDEPKHFVEGQEVTLDEYKEYGQTLCRTKVEFKRLTRYPVQVKEEPYPGG